ncbi:MAG TPA: hypothetical protein V6D17_03360 [Candidatus Obscuribacterales bacterium]
MSETSIDQQIASRLEVLKQIMSGHRMTCDVRLEELARRTIDLPDEQLHLLCKYAVLIARCEMVAPEPEPLFGRLTACAGAILRLLASPLAIWRLEEGPPVSAESLLLVGSDFERAFVAVSEQ